jgi:HEAT repeat-containing protein 5
MPKYYLDSWHLVLQALAKIMQVGDEYVFNAMHGRESTLDGPMTPEEPAAFFFVIFGLAYEALASSPSDSNLTLSTRRTTVIAALQALKSIIRPTYSGGVMVDATISEEFISLCYRMAMTETASIQVYLIELLTVFASNQHQNLSDSQNAMSVCLQSSQDHRIDCPPRDHFPLSFAESHCLQICAYVLQHAIKDCFKPAQSESVLSDGYHDITNNKSEETPFHRINLVIASFTAFRVVASSMQDPATREDIRGVAILIYHGRFFCNQSLHKSLKQGQICSKMNLVILTLWGQLL